MWKNVGHVAYHFVIVTVSAALALSLPKIAASLVQRYLQSWGQIAGNKAFLVSIEVGIAVALILIINDLHRAWKDRRLATMARTAGLLAMRAGRGLLGRRGLLRAKREQGCAREVMIMGATGYRTFVDASGDLHEVVKNCREAKIMLLDPRAEGARVRALSLPEAEVTPERFRRQIRASIAFLRDLRLLQKNVRLKLYPEPPLSKLAILGDYAWVSHYHPGEDVSRMPEFAFRHSAKPGGLYGLLREYFQARWQDPRIPEYDLETDELVYRDGPDSVRREPFVLDVAPALEPAFAG
ncbi:MAG TPA: hypothetical protein VI078_00825 [bacterium]